MPNYTQQQIDERYEKLPDVLKDAMFSPDIADKMVEAGKKAGLTLDKIGEIAEETGFVVLGLTAPKDFVKALEARLEKDAGKAVEIAKEINHQVFFPLREELKKAHNIEIAAEELEKKEPLVRRQIPTQPTTQTVPSLASGAFEAKLGTRPPTSATKPPAVSPVTAPSMPSATPAPAPTPHPLSAEKSLREAQPTKGEGGIFFETKSRVPPIDLRQAAKPPAPSQQTPIPPNAVDLREEGAFKTPAPASPPAEKKPTYEGTDPYREPPE